MFLLNNRGYNLAITSINKLKSKFSFQSRKNIFPYDRIKIYFAYVF